jgi:lysozyme family protein
MANIEKYIPILFRWEAGIIMKDNETIEQAFARAKKKGWADDPLDKGGATMIGVTIGTYRTYCKYKGKKVPTKTDLKNITYKEWRDIVHTMYWSKWKADLIENQHVANMIVDWVWASGQGIGIKRVQKLLGVTADGIVGPKTLAAVNSQDPKELFTKVYNARAAHFNAIVKNNPSQKKWLKGWMNRINYIYNLYE